ncbi:lytic transglycosylase domain-containing protein [Candidatus Saccharibacteria bacterium]|nr:lytic transglycosylase domain-containing protein [Candidatus Saccharibacteria bacterium]
MLNIFISLAVLLSSVPINLKNETKNIDTNPVSSQYELKVNPESQDLDLILVQKNIDFYTQVIAPYKKKQALLEQQAKAKAEAEAKRAAEAAAQAEADRIASEQAAARIAAEQAAANRAAIIASQQAQPAGDAQTIAKQMSDAMFGEGHWFALQALVARESGWNQYATNPYSGACGLFQALPCSKMGGMELTNQLNWGLNYIASRYGNPSNALAFHNAYGWY